MLIMLVYGSFCVCSGDCCGVGGVWFGGVDLVIVIFYCGWVSFDGVGCMDGFLFIGCWDGYGGVFLWL